MSQSTLTSRLTGPSIFHGCKNNNFQMKFFDIFLDTGYPHDGRADKDSYLHDGRADKSSYPHDRGAD